MKIAVIGSRHASGRAAAQILKELPAYTSEIVSGGAAGTDTAAEQVALILSLPIKIFYPDYARYGKAAPLMRNLEIIDYADEVLAFWDGSSRGTQHVIAQCIRKGKPVRIVPLDPGNETHPLP